jgi:hypothetical protein
MTDKELVKALRDAVNGEHDMTPHGADCLQAADRIETLTAKVEMFRDTNRRMNRRVQLLEGWWQRRLEREKNQRGTIMWMWCRDRVNQPLNVKALEEAAYQRGYDDGRDNRFNIPPRRAKPRRKGDTT